MSSFFDFLKWMVCILAGLAICYGIYTLITEQNERIHEYEMKLLEKGYQRIKLHDTVLMPIGQFEVDDQGKVVKENKPDDGGKW